MPSKKVPKAATKANAVKKGRLSAAEIGTIHAMAGKVSAEAIAKKLHRDPKQIQKELDSHLGLEPQVRLTLEDQLRQRPEWKQFEKQFSEDELEEFTHQYVQIMSQLTDNNEVMATEELQVFQVITLKILIDRTLAEQKLAMEDKIVARSFIEAMRKVKNLSDDDKADLAKAEENYDSASRTHKDCADRYKIYSDKQDKMLGMLKATRDQRVKIYENSRGSILGWVRFVMEEKNRRALGEEAGMMKRASEKEKARLSKPHKFADGTIDQPILTPETVLLEFDEEEVTVSPDIESAETTEETGLTDVGPDSV